MIDRSLIGSSISISRVGPLRIQSILSEIETYRSDEGGREAVPYNLIYLTSRTIRQPELHLLLQGDERAPSEHQWACKNE